MDVVSGLRLVFLHIQHVELYRGKTESQYDPGFVARVRKVFSRMDSNGSGFVEHEEMFQALKKLRIPATHEQIRRFVHFIDKDKDAVISFDEFLWFAAEREAEIRTVFEELDIHGDGKISKDELRHAMESLGIDSSENVLQGFFRCMDKNHSEFVEWEEFRDFLFWDPNRMHFDKKSIIRLWGARTASTDLGDISFTAPDDSISLKDPPNAIAVLLSGAIAGAFSRTATAPFDRLKTLMQASNPLIRVKHMEGGIISGLKGIYAEGGAVSFFRGNGTNVIKIAPETAIKFLAYEYLKEKVPATRWFRSEFDNSAQSNLVEKLLAGAGAGLASQTFIYPLETTKTRLAVSPQGTYSGIADCLTKTLRHDGIRGLYRGIVPSCFGIIPYAGVDLTVYTSLKEAYIKRYTDNDKEIGALPLLACGVFSSTCGQVVAYPLQLIRTRLQVQGSPGNPVLYTGMVDCFKKTVSSQGIRGLYRGIIPNFLKAIPSVSIGYVVYEHSLSFLMSNPSFSGKITDK